MGAVGKKYIVSKSGNAFLREGCCDEQDFDSGE